MAEIVIIDSTSDDDPGLQQAFDYRRAAVDPVLRGTQLSVEALLGADANRGNVESALRRADVRYVTGLGHGYPETFTGAFAQDLLEVGGYDAAEADQKVFHLLSCWTGNGLGVDLVRQGARAFFGYSVPFTFTTAAASAFLACDAAIDLAVAGGASAADAYTQAVTAFRAAIRRLEESLEVRAAAYLEANLEHLCAPSVNPTWGEPGAKVL